MKLPACLCRPLLLALGAFLCLPPAAHAVPRDLTPPFGLSWNQTALDLEEAIIGANAKIISRKREAGGGEVWQVEGLPQLALRRANFQLRKDHLAGVQLEYGKDDWTAANYDGFVKSVRQRLDEKFGAGKLVARKQDSEHGVLQTVLGYRWELPGGSVEVIYFAAQNSDNIYRTVSLHYAAPPEPEPVPYQPAR